MKTTNTPPVKSFVRPLVALVAAFSLGYLAPSQAAVVIWNTAQNITGPSDVLNTGTFDRAYAFQIGASPLTYDVNGVTFTGVGNDTNPSTMTFGSTTLSSTTSVSAIGAGGAATDGLTGNYYWLNANGFYAPLGFLTLTLNALTDGQAYRIQLWANYPNDNSKLQTITSGGNTGNLNAKNGVNGNGQFIVGTFTANSTSQVFTITGDDNFPILNAVSVYAVPEPTTWVLLALGLATVVTFRRRRNGLA